MTKPYRSSGSTNQQVAEVYTPEEIKAVMAQCRRSPRGARDRLVIVLLWATGITMSELLALGPKDIDVDAGLIALDDRRVAIPKKRRRLLRACLNRWLALRPRARTGPLICNLDGYELDASYLRRTLPRLAERAGLTRRFHAHGLRHTHAAELVEARVPAEAIRRQLGHKDVAFTAAYLRHIHPREVFEAMETFVLD